MPYAAREAGIPAAQRASGGVLTAVELFRPASSQTPALTTGPTPSVHWKSCGLPGLGVRVEVTRAWMDGCHAKIPMPRSGDGSRCCCAVPPGAMRASSCVRRDLTSTLLLPRRACAAACRRRPAGPVVRVRDRDMDTLISDEAGDHIQVKGVSTFAFAKNIRRVVPPIFRRALSRSCALQRCRGSRRVRRAPSTRAGARCRGLPFSPLPLRLRAADHTLTAKGSSQVREQVVAGDDPGGFVAPRVHDAVTGRIGGVAPHLRRCAHRRRRCFASH